VERDPPRIREDPSVEAKHTGAEQNIRLHTRLKIVGQGLSEGSHVGRAGYIFRQADPYVGSRAIMLHITG
jgi:hypothetical protein